MNLIGIVDAKFLTLLAFIILNFLVLFIVKTRTTIIISLIIAHLFAVLFFSLSISNYDSFKEIVLGLIIYSMANLFLISNYSSIHFEKKLLQKPDLRKRILIFVVIFFVVFSVFAASFFAVKNIDSFTEIVRQEKSKIIESELKNESSTTEKSLKITAGKMEKARRSLSDNFLLKRSSDVFLIIVALICGLMLFSRTNKKI